MTGCFSPSNLSCHRHNFQANVAVAFEALTIFCSSNEDPNTLDDCLPLKVLYLLQPLTLFCVHFSSFHEPTKLGDWKQQPLAAQLT